MNSRHLFVLAALVTIGIGGAATAQVAGGPPTPLALASQLDLECHSASDAPSPTEEVLIRQLNPVLKGHLPNQVAHLDSLEDVCVPVAKNGQIPGPNVLPIARWVDLACYKASAPAVNVDVELSHLNPVLSALPHEKVTLTQLEQLCVPVKKAPSDPQDPVRTIISHFDFACYGLKEPTSAVDTPLTLTHLNPVIRAMDLADRHARMTRANQLCVPVGKGNQDIPNAVQNLVEWIDFLKYRIIPQSPLAAPAFAAEIPLTLTHLNPLFANADSFDVTLTPELHLMVPVAKNGNLPPND